MAALVATSLVGLLASVDARAENIEISQSGKRVIVKVHGAKVDDVLAKLGAAYKFEVDRVSGKATAPVTGTFTGEIDDVLARLLTNDAHVIVRDSSKMAGISRILILKSRNPSGIVTIAPGASSPDGDDADGPVTTRRQQQPLRRIDPRTMQPPRFDRTQPMPPQRRILPPGFPGARTSQLEPQ